MKIVDDELYLAAKAALEALEASKEEMLISLETSKTLAGYAVTDAIIAERSAQYRDHLRAIELLKAAFSHRL
jgi:hypothetical protein